MRYHYAELVADTLGPDAMRMDRTASGADLMPQRPDAVRRGCSYTLRGASRLLMDRAPRAARRAPLRPCPRVALTA